jgi:cytochrome c oxidase assembly factor CtaG
MSASSVARAHVDLTFAAGTSWNFDPWVVLPLLVAAVLQVVGSARLWCRAGLGRGIGLDRCAYFLLGWIALAAALVSPLDALGSRSLAAHMVQHEVLMLVAAPLLILARPLEAWAWALPIVIVRMFGRGARTACVQSLWRAVVSPAGAWAIHAAAIWFWHAPALFQAALEDETVHTFQHATFFVAGLVFWWVVCAERRRLPNGGMAVALLFTTMVHTGMLGALMTFSPRLWYPWYAVHAGAAHPTPMEDQALAGLIMWVPGGVVYLGAALILSVRSIMQSLAASR